MDRRTNNSVLEKLRVCKRLLDSINGRNPNCLGHIARSNGLMQDLLLRTVPSSRWRSRPNARLSDSAKEIANISMAELNTIYLIEVLAS